MKNLRIISDEEFEETYRVNVFAMFRLCKALLPQIKEGGSIINTGSIQSSISVRILLHMPQPKRQLSASPGRLWLSQSSKGVRVNAVAPGPVWTPLIPSRMPKEKVKQFGSHTVFGRAAQLAEVAPMFVFLASV